MSFQAPKLHLSELILQPWIRHQHAYITSHSLAIQTVDLCTFLLSNGSELILLVCVLSLSLTKEGVSEETEEEEKEEGL